MRRVIFIAINHRGVYFAKFGSRFINGGRADTQLPTYLGCQKSYLFLVDGCHHLAITESGFLHITSFSENSNSHTFGLTE